jgi:Glycosyl transferase family 2
MVDGVNDRDGLFLRRARAPRSTALVTASIVVEWYNLTHAQFQRVEAMLVEVQRQAALLLLVHGGTSARLSRPIELVIVFDEEQLTTQAIEHALSPIIASQPSIAVTLLPLGGSSYCKMKNAGANAASGELIVFLDCDVIPEPEWLSALLTAFDDPAVEVVVGNTYVDCSDGGPYSKAMALSWMFPLRDPDDRLKPSTWFYANNVAFRRETFLSRLFPDVPNRLHAPAGLLVERLRRDGVAIWHAGNARASHPAPNGVKHFTKRALAFGRARAYTRADQGALRLARWVRDDVRSVLWSCKRLVVGRSKVGLNAWEVPVAVCYPLAYYALGSLGSVLTTMAPKLMHDRLDL